jgi:hypothetical protein
MWPAGSYLPTPDLDWYKHKHKHIADFGTYFKLSRGVQKWTFLEDSADKHIITIIIIIITETVLVTELLFYCWDMLSYC